MVKVVVCVYLWCVHLHVCVHMCTCVHAHTHQIRELPWVLVCVCVPVV